MIQALPLIDSLWKQLQFQVLNFWEAPNGLGLLPSKKSWLVGMKKRQERNISFFVYSSCSGMNLKAIVCHWIYIKIVFLCTHFSFGLKEESPTWALSKSNSCIYSKSQSSIDVLLPSVSCRCKAFCNNRHPLGAPYP